MSRFKRSRFSKCRSLPKWSRSRWKKRAVMYGSSVRIKRIACSLDRPYRRIQNEVLAVLRHSAGPFLALDKIRPTVFLDLPIDVSNRSVKRAETSNWPLKLGQDFGYPR